MILGRITKTYYQYSNIRLSTYIEIAQTANLRLLIIKGFPTEEELTKQWEAIVKENAKANGDQSYSAYENNLKRYGKLIGEYELVRLSLMKLVLVVDDPTIAYLTNKGFKINTATYSGYVDSINACLSKSNNYLTKIKMKLNDLQEIRDEQEKAPSKSIEELLGTLSAILGFGISEDVTLARFNEYKKIAKKKSERNKKQPV